MNIREILNSHIDKNSENILLIFPNEKLKCLFKSYFGADGLILISVNHLLHNLDGVRYREYNFLSRDIIHKLIDEIRRTNEDM